MLRINRFFQIYRKHKGESIQLDKNGLTIKGTIKDIYNSYAFCYDEDGKGVFGIDLTQKNLVYIYNKTDMKHYFIIE